MFIYMKRLLADTLFSSKRFWTNKLLYIVDVISTTFQLIHSATNDKKKEFKCPKITWNVNDPS